MLDKSQAPLTLIRCEHNATSVPKFVVFNTWNVCVEATIVQGTTGYLIYSPEGHQWLDTFGDIADAYDYIAYVWACECSTP